MTETTGTLDPQRPWITDPDELPSRMNWFGTLLNPVGRSPKLHFTRAWTVFFMSRAILVGLLILGPLIFSLAGGDAGPLQAVIGGALLVTVLLTEIFSFVLHNRRMADAGKSGFWAIIVLVPAILAVGAVAFATPGLIKQHAEVVAKAEAEQSEDADRPANTRRAARSASSGRGGRGRRGGRRGGGGPGADGGVPSQQQFVMSRVMPMAGGLWLFGSLLAMLWTLLWAARLPSQSRDSDYA